MYQTNCTTDKPRNGTGIVQERLKQARNQRWIDEM